MEPRYTPTGPSNCVHASLQAMRKQRGGYIRFRYTTWSKREDSPSTFLPLLALCWLVGWVGLVLAQWASYIADGKWMHAEFSPDGEQWFSFMPPGAKSRRGMFGAFWFRGRWERLPKRRRRVADERAGLFSEGSKWWGLKNPLFRKGDKRLVAKAMQL